jgi:hypothetical protein
MTTISDPKGGNTAPGLLPIVQAQDAISVEDPLFCYLIITTYFILLQVGEYTPMAARKGQKKCTIPL